MPHFVIRLALDALLIFFPCPHTLLKQTCLNHILELFSLVLRLSHLYFMNPSFSPDYFKVATNDGHNFYLLEDVTYTSKDGTVYILPKGATSDGASVPEVLWNVLPPFGKYWQAAYLHDCAYRDTLKTADGAYASLDETKSNDLLQEVME